MAPQGGRWQRRIQAAESAGRLLDELSVDQTEQYRRAVLTRRHLDLSGSTLKDLLYEAIPEMTNANWHASVDWPLPVPAKQPGPVLACQSCDWWAGTPTDLARHAHHAHNRPLRPSERQPVTGDELDDMKASL